MIRYKHTQFGWVIVVGVLLVALVMFLTRNGMPSGTDGALLIGLSVLFLILLLFHSLTAEVSDENVKVYFGIGLIRKTIPLREIESCVVQSNKFLLGWGIRFGLSFTLWNVSGFDAVELTFKGKKWKFRIGTDRPQELCDEIVAAVREQAQ